MQTVTDGLVLIWHHDICNRHPNDVARLAYIGYTQCNYILKIISVHWHSRNWDYGVSFVFFRWFTVLCRILTALQIIVFTCSFIQRLLSTHLPLLWRHDGRDGVSNHQPHDCLLIHSFRRRSKETSKLRVTGFCVGNSPVTDQQMHLIWA